MSACQSIKSDWILPTVTHWGTTARSFQFRSLEGSCCYQRAGGIVETVRNYQILEPEQPSHTQSLCRLPTTMAKAIACTNHPAVQLMLAKIGSSRFRICSILDIFRFHSGPTASVRRASSQHREATQHC